MGIFSIMRQQFLDRVFGADELRALAEMLRLWYLICASDHRQTGQLRCEARVYAFPRTQTDAIRQSLTARLPAATLDGSDPDELRVIAPPQSATKIADLSIWREVLSDPLLARLSAVANHDRRSREELERP